MTGKDIPVLSCAICQEKSDNYQLAVFDQIEFWACKNCESVTTTPQPTAEEIEDALNGSFYARKSVFSASRERKHFIKHLQDIQSFVSGRKFIDVLARTGGRVELARIGQFPKAMGIDTNKYCLDMAKKRFHKALIEQNTLDDIVQSGEKFDVVCSAGGLENALNPDEYIEKLKKLMNADACLYLSLCDGNHFMIPQNFLRWKELRYPERVYYISRKGLELLLKRHGLKIVKRYLRFLPYQQVIVKQEKP